MSYWRLQKLDYSGAVLAEWAADDIEAQQVGLGSPFQWAAGRLGDLRDLTFVADLYLKPFALGEYVRLYTDFNNSGTESIAFTGLVTEVPSSDTGYAGTVRVSGLRRLLEGRPAPLREYTGPITEPINDIIAGLPPLIPVAVNDSTTWTQQLEYWYAGHVSAAEALDSLVAIGGGIWSIADDGLNIRGPGYFANYVPSGTYYIIQSPLVKDHPITAIKVRLVDVGGRTWTQAAAEDIMQTQETKDLSPPPSFALAQTVIVDSAKHATQPYTVSVGISGDKPHESARPATVEVRTVSAAGVLGTPTSHTNDGATAVSYTLDNNAGLVFSPPSALFSASWAIVGCLYYMVVGTPAGPTRLAVLGAGGKKLPTTGSLGSHILSRVTDTLTRTPTRAAEWSDQQQNVHTMAIMTTSAGPASGAAVGGELYSGWRDFAVVQQTLSNMWQPIIYLRNISGATATVQVTLYYEYYLITTGAINGIVLAQMPIPNPYAVVIPFSNPRRWLTVTPPGYATYTIDHCEYTLSNEEGPVTRIYTTSSVDPSIARQIAAVSKTSKGRL